MPLLALILADPASALDPVRLSGLLLADVIQHEHLPQSPLDTVTRGKRVRHAARFITASESTVSQALPTPPGTAAGDWLALTVLPVSVEHDEYFFIRALQAHELVFTTLTELVNHARDDVLAGLPEAAAAIVRRAHDLLQRAATLFRVVATMRPQDFHAFRVHTDGASAIQSEAYKRFELACGMPTADRLASEAFTSVPAVVSELDDRTPARSAPARPPTAPDVPAAGSATTGPGDLSAAVADRLAAGTSDGELAELISALADLEASHQRWKAAHHGLAARMPNSSEPAAETRVAPLPVGGQIHALGAIQRLVPQCALVPGLTRLFTRLSR